MSEHTLPPGWSGSEPVEETRSNAALPAIQCRPFCRMCQKSLTVTREPIAYVRIRGEWMPSSATVRACDEHPSTPPEWRVIEAGDKLTGEAKPVRSSP